MFRRPVGKQHSRAFVKGLGLLGLALAAITFYVGYEAANTVPLRSYYNLHAEFANADNLSNHYEIREGGVRIGQLLNPRVHDGKALVDLRIGARYKPLRSDTQLRIRLRSAVGVRYLEVIPGTKGTPLPDGATIPAANAQTPVALDKVLGLFDAPTRARTRTLLNELGAGTLSRGPDVNETIATAPHLVSSLGSFSSTIVARHDALARFIQTGNDAAGAFDPVRDDIARGFAPERQALAPFADARSDVQATLSSAGPALASLQRTLPAVSGLLDEVTRFSTDTRRTLEQAPAPLRSASSLIGDASKPLGNLKRTLDLADRAVPPILGLLGKVRPSLPPIKKTLGDVLPTLDYLAPRACDMTQFATGWAEYTKWGDQYNGFIRFLVAAARPEQPAMTTAKFDPLQSAVNSDPYPGPCHNGVGVTGWPQPTEQESQRGEVYSATNLPGGG